MSGSHSCDLAFVGLTRHFQAAEQPPTDSFMQPARHLAIQPIHALVSLTIFIHLLYQKPTYCPPPAHFLSIHQTNNKETLSGSNEWHHYSVTMFGY